MPSRYLRPAIRNSERFNRVSFEAQSLWLRLLTLVDDYGRYDGRLSVILGECFSVFNELHPETCMNLQKVAASCGELQEAGLAYFYTVQQKKVVQLLQWKENIRPGVKERWPAHENSPQVAPNPGDLREVAGTCGNAPASPSSSPSSSSSPSPSQTEREKSNGSVQASRTRWGALRVRIRQLELHETELTEAEREELFKKKRELESLSERQSEGKFE